MGDFCLPRRKIIHEKGHFIHLSNKYKFTYVAKYLCREKRVSGERGFFFFASKPSRNKEAVFSINENKHAIEHNLNYSATLP